MLLANQSAIQITKMVSLRKPSSGSSAAHRRFHHPWHRARSGSRAPRRGSAPCRRPALPRSLNNRCSARLRWDRPDRIQSSVASCLLLWRPIPSRRPIPEHREESHKRLWECAFGSCAVPSPTRHSLPQAQGSPLQRGSAPRACVRVLHGRGCGRVKEDFLQLQTRSASSSSVKLLKPRSGVILSDQISSIRSARAIGSSSPWLG